MTLITTVKCDKQIGLNNRQDLMTKYYEDKTR